jgi:predicted tellurium resistance membrane protein TerC
MADPNAWISLLTLTALEIVLGLDNVIFISILAGKLPAGQQAKARTIGLTLALVTRILLLLTINWLMHLTKPLFELLGRGFSGKDLILLVGGLFLIAKGTREIHERLEGSSGGQKVKASNSSLFGIVIQIILIDIVFSLDSVITVVGMAQHLPVMIGAVTIAVVVMLFAAGVISDFVNRRPTIRMLALAFLILIGAVLAADGLGQHIDRGYVYFAMAFAVAVEMLNLKDRVGRGPDSRSSSGE